MSGILNLVPAVERPNLVAPSTLRVLVRLAESWAGPRVLVAEIDTSYLRGEDFCRHYNVATGSAANCLLVEGVRAEHVWRASCLTRVGHRADLNGVIRRGLGARRVTLLEASETLADLGMQKGSITPIGLPEEWPVFVEESLRESEYVYMGSGVVNSKLAVPASLLFSLPQVVVV